MKKIETIEQYKELKARARIDGIRLSTNCLLTVKGIQDLIDLGRLYYEEFEEGLVVYADEELYYRAFYWLNDDMALPDMRQDKPVSIEEIDSSDGKRADYLGRFFDKLEHAGWHKIARNVYVERILSGQEESINGDYKKARAGLEEQGLKLQFCKEKDVQRVISLWRDYLHLTDIPAEHLDFYNDDSQRVVCVVDGDFVCAVNWWQFKGGRCETRHIVTDPEYYKRGIAYALQLAAVHDAVSQGCRSVFTYIDEVNYRSLALFKKVGIVPNGRVTYQYGIEGRD